MTKPVTIPNTFATATTAIPLSNLDADFSTVATAMNDANTYSNYAADTGSANAYVVTLTGISAIYSAGLRIQFKAGNANTTASTLNVNAQGAKNITYQDASAIASGTIAANSIVDVMYDGTQFLLMNDPAGATGGDVVGPASATDNAIVRFDGTTGKLVQNSVVTIADSTGDISGVGQLNATTVDTTNIEVTNIKAKDGTAAASIANSTGVVSITANPVLSGGTANGVLYLNGSKVATSGSGLVFDSSGNLGLGVTPSSSILPALQIYSGASLNGISTGVQLAGNAYFGSGSQWKYIGSGKAARIDINENDSGGMSFNVASSSGTAGNAITFTQAMTLDANGRLALGTSSASTSRLTIEDNSNQLRLRNTTTRYRTDYAVNNVGVAEINVFDDSGGVYMPFNLASSEIKFSTGSGSVTERARITSGGDFRVKGAGTAGSTDAFQVSGSAPADAARLDSSGNLLVGTTTTNGAKLQVYHTGNSEVAFFTADNASFTDNVLRLDCTRNTTNSTWNFLECTVPGISNRLFIRDSGDVVNVNNSYGAISDAKLKENIVDASPKLADLMQVRVRNYNFKEGQTHKQIGVVAQELEQIFPGMVNESPDRDADGNDLGTTTKQVKYSVFVPMLIKAIQEQQALIESLTTRVSQLEGA